MPVLVLVRRLLTVLFRMIRMLALLIGSSILILLVTLFFAVQNVESAKLSFLNSKDKMTQVPEQALLFLDVHGVLVDHLTPQEQLYSNLLPNSEDEVQDATDAHNLIAALERAAKDKRVQGAVLDLSNFLHGSPALLDSVSQAIQRFRNADKKILATGIYLSQSAYYLAAQSDFILLDPMGAVDIRGFGAYSLYLREALDKLGLTVYAFVAGDYKSAPEVFTRTNMSEYSKAASSRWTNKMWKMWKSEVAHRIEVDERMLQQYADQPHLLVRQTRGDLSQAALHANLVDALHPLAGYNKYDAVALYAQFERELLQDADEANSKEAESDITAVELERELAAAARANSDEAGREFTAIQWQQYLSLTGGIAGKADKNSEKAKVAVLFAQGSIALEDGASTFDAARLAGEILQLSQLPHPPRALVLRLDSNGGSVFATELIRRAIEQLKQEGIPVVVSFGSVGASGAYYLASAADQIWASPSTITGSIGVFAVAATAEQASSSLGIHRDGVGSTNMSGSNSWLEPMHPNYQALFQSFVDYTYLNFKELIAENRDMTLQQVEKVARGQVWLGTEAREHELLDGLGTLQDAIAAAAALADIPAGEYLIWFVRTKANLLDAVLERISPFLLNTFSLKLPIQQHAPAATLLLTRYLRHPDPRGLYMECLTCPTTRSPSSAGHLPTTAH